MIRIQRKADSPQKVIYLQVRNILTYTLCQSSINRNLHGLLTFAGHPEIPACPHTTAWRAAQG